MANPCHREGQAILIPAFGNEVEIVISVDNVFGPASVGGIGMENVAVLIRVENTDSRRFDSGARGRTSTAPAEAAGQRAAQSSVSAELAPQGIRVNLVC